MVYIDLLGEYLEGQTDRESGHAVPARISPRRIFKLSSRSQNCVGKV